MKWIVIGCAIAVAGLGGCECSETGESTGQMRDNGGGESASISGEDWPDEAERIVSMAPNVTEVLFEMELGDRVVAVTRYCDWPEEVDELPTIGGMLDPDYESILAANPEAVIGVIDGADHRIQQQLEQAGVAYGFVAMDDVDSVRRGIEQIGQWLGYTQKAGGLIEEFDERLDDKVEHRRRESSPRALMVFDRQPVVAAGPGTYGDELLKLVGLDNAVDDAMGEYPVLDGEAVIAADPQVVVDVTVEAGAEDEDYWRRFDSVEAVKTDRVVQIDDPVMMRPGLRIPEAVELLDEAVESP